MMKKHLFVLLFLSFCWNSWSFSSDEIQTVYQRLITAVGDQQREWPQLQIRPGANSVLAYNKQKNIIFIDEKALEICKTFGVKKADALAFLLAHEMTHFYQEHQWKEAGFGSRFVIEKAAYNQHELDEKEADLFGAFTSYLADYQSVAIIPQLFDKVYTAYQLEEKLVDYPSLQERKAIATEVCKKTKELILVFESANYFHAVGEHLAAASLYEHLLGFVKYKELYNNLGASLVAAAAQSMSKTELQFQYPIEVDSDIPLRDGKLVDPQILLQKGIHYLSLATQMDNRHYRAFLNLTCAYTIKGDHQKAEQLLFQLQSIFPKKAQLKMVEAILAAKKGQKDQATQLLNTALQISENSATRNSIHYNQAILSGQATTSTSINFYSSEEQIDGIDLTYQNEVDFKEIFISNPFTQEEEILGIHPNQRSNLIHFDLNEKTVALLLTNNKSAKTKNGIGIGSTFQTLQAHFKNAKIFNHSRGYYLVFPQQKILFDMTTADQVRAWGLYEIY